MDLGLRGRKAIVTGATKGIGRAIAEVLAAEGCGVGICARDAGDVEGAVAALSATGVAAAGAALDVADGDALNSWVGDMAAKLGGLDIVVANVSALAIGPDEAAWRRDFDIDVMHTVRVVEAALPHMETSDAGAIVVISSVSGVQIDGAAGPYGAMKAALIHYTAGLSRRLAPKGIRANTVSPGTVYFEGGVWNAIETNDPARFKDALARNPMGRMARPGEIANAVAFLASPAASFVTGTNMIVDGAFSTGVQF